MKFFKKNSQFQTPDTGHQNAADENEAKSSIWEKRCLHKLLVGGETSSWKQATKMFLKIFVLVVVSFGFLGKFFRVFRCLWVGCLIHQQHVQNAMEPTTTFTSSTGKFSQTLLRTMGEFSTVCLWRDNLLTLRNF